MEFQRFTKTNILTNSLIVIIYLLWTNIIGGIRPEHYFLVVLWVVMFYSFDTSRRIVIGFSIFIIFWIIYDSMRIIPNYEVSTVHIKEPYLFEKYLFGINFNGELLTPNEYFARISNKFMDFISGFFYINWMPVPIGFGIYLFIKDKYLFLKFSIAFLLVNLVGFSIYYIYPAAPPWYVELYGFDLHFGIPGNRAGLARFDELVGIPVFANIYNKNANVLAAMPSLHASYPVIVLFYAIKKRLGWINVLFAIFMLGIWFSAVYSGHHYIIDVTLGICIAIISVTLFELATKYSFFEKPIKKLTKIITIDKFN